MNPQTPTPALTDKPEILAPAGGRAQLEAAVWAGADAVYFGLDSGLNARVRATSFALDELGPTMDYLHERGVRGYLTLNTLVYDDELARAESLLRHAAEAGVDALIVQDIGLVRLARQVAPALPVHGSTQMSITDTAGVELAASLGARRVVLGRELSIDEIAQIVAASPVEIEVFVHGALCVSYSGQCFSSEAWGGRSANRGQCAQACRLPYELIVDGERRDQHDLRYLLSPQDLMALELLPRLVRAGVHSFKIEGRLKGPDYVLATVSAYRETLDRVWADIGQGDRSNSVTLDRKRRRELAQVFSRGQNADNDGLTPGFLLGPQHQHLVIGRNPRHRGLFVGEVISVSERGVRTRLQGPVKRGDGLVFDRGKPEQREFGGNVHHVIDRDGISLTEQSDSGEVELLFGDTLPLSKIHAGDLIWRTRDSAHDGITQLDPRHAARPVAVRIDIDGAIDEPLTLSLSDRDGPRITVSSDMPLQKASGRPLDRAALAKAIGTLGDTPFRLDELVVAPALLDAGLFLPVAAIKQARRSVVEALLAARRRHQRAADLAEPGQLARLLPHADPVDQSPPRLSLLCRTQAQVDAALAITEVDEIVVDFLEVHGLKEACAAVREHRRRLVVAAPRIFKPGEQRLWRYYCRLQPDALLVRSAGLLWTLNQAGGSGALLDDGETRIPPLHGDFSLNAANLLTADHLLGLGLQRLTLTHDLNASQCAALARSLPAAQRAKIEVVAHQHLPIFHTEYCLFARYLSRGNSYRDCGRPCETHQVHVRDPAGGDHLVQADIGCRNTVFNAAAQSAGPVLNELRAAGIRHYRIELVDEPAAQVAAIFSAYQATLAGEMNASALRERLARVVDANGHAQGVGLGSLAVRVEARREAMKKPTAR
ncbi:MAG: U32 family peptidase [Gammaproteobacteria bacterium]|nr:U32 family peptidase [Gammaproteobacteria bacterium]